MNEKRFNELAEDLMRQVVAHYQRNPSEAAAGNPDLVFEALNALASIAARIIQGTGFAAPPQEFFQKAVADQLEAFRREGRRELN